MTILDKKFGGQFEGVVAYIYELYASGRQCVGQSVEVLNAANNSKFREFIQFTQYINLEVVPDTD
jgi:hypothetical protein